MKKIFSILAALFAATNAFATAPNINWWLTKGDQSALLQQQPTTLVFGKETNTAPYITVDTVKKYQGIDGFGFALTGSSAQLINQMPESIKGALLRQLFGSEKNSIGISYIRVSIGASDLSPSVYSYDDIAGGDESLSHFSLGPDQSLMVPLLHKILQLNPQLKIMASPWSAPAWMKDNGSTIGGTLQTKYYGVYADYLVKYIQAMNAAGIKIESISPQNEPLALQNNPSMGFTAAQELAFVRNNLGPAFKKAGITTKIIIWDHNCDNPQYPLTVLGDAAAKQYIAGSAFHLYAGDISALSQVHNAHPDKQVYFTEQYTASTGDFGGDLKWHMKNVATGSLRNWSRNVIEWNLANDPSYGPHTPGGCSTCKGALTINRTDVKMNVSYYIIGHVSKFVPPGSIRVWSTVTGELNTVAFVTSAGKKVLVVENDGNHSQEFNIRFNGQWAVTSLEAGSVATYVW